MDVGVVDAGAAVQFGRARSRTCLSEVRLWGSQQFARSMAGARRGGRQQSLGAQPDLEQVRPLIESGIGFAQSYAVRPVVEDVRLRRDAGLHQRLVITQPLF